MLQQQPYPFLPFIYTMARKSSKKQKKIEVLYKLDKLDFAIIWMLTRKKRMSTEEIACVCGVSRSTIQSHKKQMQKNGILSGPYYIIDWNKLGYTYQVFAWIKIQKGYSIEYAQSELLKIRAVFEVYCVMNALTPLMIKVCSRSSKGIRNVLYGKIQQIPGLMVNRIEQICEQYRNFEFPYDI